MHSKYLKIIELCSNVEILKLFQTDIFDLFDPTCSPWLGFFDFFELSRSEKRLKRTCPKLFAGMTDKSFVAVCFPLLPLSLGIVKKLPMGSNGCPTCSPKLPQKAMVPKEFPKATGKVSESYPKATQEPPQSTTSTAPPFSPDGGAPKTDIDELCTGGLQNAAASRGGRENMFWIFRKKWLLT